MGGGERRSIRRVRWSRLSATVFEEECRRASMRPLYGGSRRGRKRNFELPAAAAAARWRRGLLDPVQCGRGGDVWRKCSQGTGARSRPGPARRGARLVPTRRGSWAGCSLALRLLPCMDVHLMFMFVQHAGRDPLAGTARLEHRPGSCQPEPRRACRRPGPPNAGRAKVP